MQGSFFIIHAFNLHGLTIANSMSCKEMVTKDSFLHKDKWLFQEFSFRTVPVLKKSLDFLFVMM